MCSPSKKATDPSSTRLTPATLTVRFIFWPSVAFESSDNTCNLALLTVILAVLVTESWFASPTVVTVNVWLPTSKFEIIITLPSTSTPTPSTIAVNSVAPSVFTVMLREVPYVRVVLLTVILESAFKTVILAVLVTEI